MISKAAKAAAILVFTSGVQDYEQAALIYNAIDYSEDPPDDVLENYPGVRRWHEVEHMGGDDWWDNVVMHAKCITAAHKHFEESL
jgi:hypothetical protein